MFLYYITDRKQFPGGESERRRRLLDRISEAATLGIDFVQLREKDLTAHELELLVREALHVLKTVPEARRTKLLINSRTDISLAAGADGVHLRGEDVSPGIVRSVWSTSAGDVPRAIVAVSCHSEADVRRVASEGADFCVFAPVFEKEYFAPVGLNRLRDACHNPIPVLALGGVTLANAQACLSAGAAGIAGIRLFQENDLAQLIPKLRAQPATPLGI